MKAVGVIAEYNPFHNGHLFHLKAAKEISGRPYAVVVMSGGYVQRGEPAVIPKSARVRAALEHGADAVLELPVFYATAAADYFARGAVKLLAAAGVADAVCFGSESGDIDALKTAAALLLNEPEAFKATLKRHLSAGLSYAAARGKALEAILAREDFFTWPNNNLGIAYIKALMQMESPMDVFTVKRVPAENRVSASVIRAKILAGEAVDKYLPSLPNLSNPRSLDDYSAFFKTFLRRAKELYRVNLAGAYEPCLNTPDMAEGLENRFLREAGRHEKLSQILAAVKTKRYALTRVQRTALHLILGITQGDMAALESAGGPPYIRLLGFRKDSAGLVNAIAAKAALPFIADTAAAKKILPPFALKVFERELRIEPPLAVIKV